MKCKECKLFDSINNTTETGNGICTYGYDWQPTTESTDCRVIPTPYTCADCQHFIEHDTACMTANADDSIYMEDGRECCGFEDGNFWKLVDILIEWKMRGINIENKVAEAVKRMRELEVPERKDGEQK